MSHHRHPAKITPTPLFSQKIYVDSKFASKLSLKRHIKYPSSLKISFLYLNKQDADLLKNLENPLMKLLKQSKSTQKIHLQECKIAEVIHPNHLLQLIKLSQKILSLSVPCYFLNKEQSNATLQWLKRTPKLKQFHSILELYQILQGVSPFDFFKQPTPHQKIFKEIQRKRLESIEMTPYVGIENLSFFKKLTAIRKISFRDPMRYAKISGVYIDNSLLVENLFANMAQLQVLEFLVPVGLRSIYSILDSIPNPEQIKTLGFEISDFVAQSYETHFLITLALNDFRSLQSFNLTCYTEILSLAVLENLSEFPFLQELSLTLSLKASHFQVLGNILRKLFALKTLDLELRAMQEGGDLICLVQSLRFLTQLQKLNLAISQGYKKNDDNSTYIDQVVSSFSKSLENFTLLKKLKFNFPFGNYTEELSDLTNVLKNKLHGLERLELYFGRKEIKPKDLQQFVHSLEKLKNLEILTLRELNINEPNILVRMARILSRAKNLIKVDLDGMKITTPPDILVEMMEIILAKKGLEYFRIQSFYSKMTEENPKKLVDIKSILERNPNLKFPVVTTDRQELIQGLQNFQIYKWS